MSIIGDGIMLGAGGETASIFITGLSQSDTVTATKDGKTISGKWVSESESGRFTAGHPEYIVSAADYLLYTYSSRNYKKAYAGDAYACTVVVNGWLSSLLVSKTANAVSIYTDGNHSSGILKSELTVTYLGETWYVSSSGAAYQATAPATSNVAHFGTFATREEAALAFLKNVAPQPMDGFEISPIKSYGTWHITATNGTKTATSDVVVDSASEHTVELLYGLKLYWDGDECTDVTGGISAYTYLSSAHITKNNDNIYIGGTGDGAGGRIYTTNTIDLSKYSKICFETSDLSYVNCRVRAGIYYDITSSNFGTIVGGWDRPSENKSGTLLYSNINQGDISSVTGTHTVGLEFATGGAYSNSSVSGYVYKIWLE